MQIFPVALVRMFPRRWRTSREVLAEVFVGLHYYFNLVKVCQIVNLYKYIYLILGVFTAFFPGSRLCTSQGSKGSPNRVQGCPMGRGGGNINVANDHILRIKCWNPSGCIKWNWVKIVDFQEKNVFSIFQIVFFVSKVVDFQLNGYLLVEVGRYISVSLIKRNSFLHIFFWRCGMGLWSWPW